MSYPQQPCPTPVDSCLWLLLWNQSTLYLAILFLFCLIFFSALYSLFQRTLPSMMCLKLDNFNFVTCASSNVLGFICSRTHLFAFLSRICRALLQHYESFLCLSAFFTFQHSHLLLVIGNARVWMILVLVSKDTCLLLVVFPNSPT